MIFINQPPAPPPVVALTHTDESALLAQAIVPESQTNVDINADEITISGGEQAGDNLFYGFEQFNVPTDTTADFLANPSVQRVIGHVTGGNGSHIDGLLTITGGAADLFIINPAGILFGPNARLDLPATFTATTAHGLKFGDQWFKIAGENAIEELSGVPSGLAFSETSGAIVNLAELSADSGLMLAAGTVIDLGALNSADGPIQVLSKESGGVVLENGLLRLNLSLDSLPTDIAETPVSLADLLTGGTAEQAAALVVDNAGNIALAGDSVVSEVNAQTALIAADNTLYLPSSNLATTGALTLVGEQLYATDSEAQPLTLEAGGRLTLQGSESINVLALFNDQTTISGGDVVLASDGEISLDAHISSDSNVNFATLDQQSADFISLYDPIISANGDVSFGSYSGPALKVEATGSITANGDITITGPDTTLSPILNWESIGDVSFENSQFGFGPAIAPSQIALNIVAGSDTVTRAELEVFLGLPNGSLNSLGDGNANRGSAITTTFDAQAGDTVSFDWNFVTRLTNNFDTADDVAFIALTGEPLDELVTSDSPGLNPTAESFENFPRIFISPSDSSTGSQTFSEVIPADGSYTLSIGLIRQNLSSGNSVLLVENTSPVPTLISDNSLLATTPALVLRAGETNLQNAANVPQLDVPDINTDFVPADIGTEPASITINGNIDTSGSDSEGGPVILSAPGSVTLRDVNTRAEYSGDIVITGSEIMAGQLDAGGGFLNDSEVMLTSTDGKIVLETVSAGSDGIDITAAGLFQATDSFNTSVRITLNPVEDADLIAFLQEVDADAFSQIDLNEQIEISLPVSVATSPDSGEQGRIRIRHGGAGIATTNEVYTIEGTEAVTSTPFFVGPNADNVTITINPEGSTFQATVSGFVPLFSDTDFPTEASGTNGAIAQLTGDGSLATAFFNEPFVPEVPSGPGSNPGTNPGVGPNPGGGPNPSPGPNPGAGPQPTEPSGPEFSTADTDNLEETDDEDTVATDEESDDLLALRGSPEECDADEITQENGVTQLLGDCLEEDNNRETPQSSAPFEPVSEVQLEAKPSNNVSIQP